MFDNFGGICYDNSMKVAAFEVHEYEDQDFLRAADYGLDLKIYREKLTQDTLPLINGCEGVCILGHSILDEKLLTALKKAGVKFITTRTIGYNHIDTNAAKRLQIRLSNASYSPYNVADFTVMLMLMLLRKAKIAALRSLVNDFSLDGMMGRELRSMTVGVVGAGKIGKTVIQNLSGFGCKILVYDPYVSADALPHCAKSVSLDELLKNSDILSLHIPYTAENHHLISRERMQMMKRGALLVNTARGELIDTEAMIEALESGQLGGAGIDTVEDEENVCHVDLGTKILPKRNLFYLKQLPNVIYTPHIAFFTQEATAAMVHSALESFRLFEANEPNPYEIKL